MVFEMAVVQLSILTAELGQGGCELTVSLWTSLPYCLESQLIYTQLYSSQ